MTRVSGACVQERPAVEYYRARARPAHRALLQPTCPNDGWSRQLVALEGGGLHRSQPGESSGAVRVLIAERVSLVRAGLRSLLDGEHDITVTGEAWCGNQAVALATETQPDVVLMGIDLPGMSGLAAACRILADSNLSATKVVILTAEEREEDLFGAVRCGACGFVLMGAEPEELLRAVRVVAGGGAELSPWATHRLLEEFAHFPPLPNYHEQFEQLTARERDIVSLVALGLTNSEIAERLMISRATAKTHVSRAMVKLEVRDRAKLVALAHQTGFAQLRRAAEVRVAGGRPALRLADAETA